MPEQERGIESHSAESNSLTRVGRPSHQEDPPIEGRRKRKVFEGKVVGNRMEKTRIVLIETRYRHRLYEKVLVSKKRIYVHDEENKTKKGDWVQVMETRPLSKTKRWRIVKILRIA